MKVKVSKSEFPFLAQTQINYRAKSEKYISFMRSALKKKLLSKTTRNIWSRNNSTILSTINITGQNNIYPTLSPYRNRSRTITDKQREKRSKTVLHSKRHTQTNFWPSNTSQDTEFNTIKNTNMPDIRNEKNKTLHPDDICMGLLGLKNYSHINIVDGLGKLNLQNLRKIIQDKRRKTLIHDISDSESDRGHKRAKSFHTIQKNVGTYKLPFKSSFRQKKFKGSTIKMYNNCSGIYFGDTLKTNLTQKLKYLNIKKYCSSSRRSPKLI